MSSEEPAKARERSRRYPFIPLNKALERAQQLKDANGLHAARVHSVVDAWGYSEKSSGGRQTIGALIMYGILTDFGTGQDRKLQLTELAQRYLLDKRPEVRADTLKKMALEPEVMNLLWNNWGSPPPSDNECVSQLVFDYGFTEGAASEMLEIYKANVDFSQLAKTSPALATDQNSNVSSSVPVSGESPQPQQTAKDPFDQIFAGWFSQGSQATSQSAESAGNDVKVVQDGKKLQVIGKNLDLEGVKKLRALLEKYEEILALM